MDVRLLPPSGFCTVQRILRPKSSLAGPIAEHHVRVQLSASTRTVCRASGLAFVRLRGDIDFTPANERLGFDMAEDSESLELHIPAYMLERVALAYDLPAARIGFSHRHLVRNPSLSHLALAIESEQHTLTASPYLDVLGVALAVRLLDGRRPVPSATRAPAAAASPRVQRVLAYIDENLDGLLSLGRLARVAGLSSAQLRREFGVSQGTTLHRYIALQRVERARQLLLKRALPASEVALSAGFSHQSHMARWIKRVLGVTPSELLRANC